MTSSGCPYSAFVKHTGVRAYRVLDIAVIDVAVTVAAAAVLARVLRWPFWYVLVCVLVLGIGAHRLFGVHTTVDRWLFGDGP